MSRTDTADVLIVTALRAEAQPLIEHYGLKQDTAIPYLPVFAGDRIRLAVGRPGKAKGAVAATFLLATAPSLANTVVLNVGVAGYAGDPITDKVEYGEVFVVNRIRDQASGAEYFPDLLVRTDCRETALTTFDYGVDAGAAPDNLQGLVDMEAAGVYQAAATFLPPHRIGFIKVVSDFLELDKLNLPGIEELMRRRVDACGRLIEAYAAIDADRREVLSADDKDLLAQVVTSLRLTVTQQEQLTEWARCCCLRTQKLPDLAAFIGIDVKQKSEGKRRLAQLRTVLLGDGA